MEDSGVVIERVNTTLDSYGIPKSKEETEERLKYLKKELEVMRLLNFNTPALSLKKLLPALHESEDEDLYEALTALKRYIYSIQIKKWTLERTMVSFYAHRLAMSIFETDRMSEYLNYLPYSGSYMDIVDNGPSFMVFSDFIQKKFLPRSSRIVVLYLSLKRAKERTEIPELSERAKKYTEIVLSFGLDNIYQNEEVMWLLLQKLEENGFLTEEGEVDPDILREIRTKRFRGYHYLLENTKEELTKFLVQYYIYFTLSKKRPLRGISNIGAIESILSDIKSCNKTRDKVISLLKRAETVLSRSYDRGIADKIVGSLCGDTPHLERVEEFLEALEDAKSKKS